VFPITHKSLVERVRSDVPAEREQALEALLTAYWLPIYSYLRVAWKAEHEDAEDLTQELVARGIPNEVLVQFDPARGRLRTFLRLYIDRFMANEYKAALRLKRAGALRSVSIHLSDIETELARQAMRQNDDRNDFFRRELARSVFGTAIDELRVRCETRGKQVPFSMFMRYDVEGGGPDGPSYAQLAAEAGVSVTQVTNYLAAVRRDFRQITLDVLRRMTMTDDEFRQEARELLGIEVP
jgi:RNA polymerase sigma-70 factor (ECF subfamily)